MPTYDYRCNTCTVSFEAFRSMRDEDSEQCPSCKSYQCVRVPSVPNTDMREFKTPIEMFSIALDTDEDIREFKRKAPDVDIGTDPDREDYGIPIARTRKQKLAALRAVGYTEKK